MNTTDKLAEALRAVLNDGGPAAMGAAYDALAEYDAERAGTTECGHSKYDPCHNCG